MVRAVLFAAIVAFTSPFLSNSGLDVALLAWNDAVLCCVFYLVFPAGPVPRGQ